VDFIGLCKSSSQRDSKDSVESDVNGEDNGFPKLDLFKISNTMSLKNHLCETGDFEIV